MKLFYLTPAHEAFCVHLDGCVWCCDHPFERCERGAALYRAFSLSVETDEEKTRREAEEKRA